MISKPSRGTVPQQEHRTLHNDNAGPNTMANTNAKPNANANTGAKS